MKDRSINEGMLRFDDRSFICPHCGEKTTVVSPAERIFIKLASCNFCKTPFLIRDNKLERLAS